MIDIQHMGHSLRLLAVSNFIRLFCNDELVVGSVVPALVESIVSYGAVVKVGKERGSHSGSEKLEIGHIIDVEISSVKYDEKKISLKAVKR